MAKHVAYADGNFSDPVWHAAATSLCFTQTDISDGTHYTDATTAFTSSPTGLSGETATIDAIALNVAQISVGIGTFTVDLYNNDAAVSLGSVTVNVADLPTSGHRKWALFKLPAPASVVSGTTYVLRFKSDAINQVRVFAAASGSVARLARKSSSSTPAAADTAYILGNLTGPGLGQDRRVRADGGESGVTVVVGKRGFFPTAPAMLVDACALNTVTLHNETEADVLFEGGYTIPASSNIVIDFTTMSCWRQQATRTACLSADAFGHVVTIAAST
jgi:hypothetical protein